MVKKTRSNHYLCIMILEHFPDTARVWIYTSNRPVSDKDREEIAASADQFLEKWAAHGTQLLAAGEWLNPYQYAVALDESAAGASGCSIDSQTRFMREIGTQYSIDWFDRMNMILEENGTVERVSFFDLGNHPDARLFDNLVQHLAELRSNWPVPMKESRYKHFL